MNRFFVGVLVIVAALVSGLALQALLAQETSAPPHAQAGSAPAPLGTSDQAFTDWSERRTLTDWVAVYEYRTWIEGVERWERERQLEAERLAAEAATQARTSGVRRSVSGASTSVGGDCSGFVIPSDIVWAESRCDYGAYNATGCGGYGCIGAYQFDSRHYGSWGGCADLGTDPAGQDECARRLSNNGTNLQPWGR